MMIFDVAVYVLLVLMAIVLVLRLFISFKFYVPVGILALVLGFLFVFKTSLPPIFSYRFNTFYITYHNAEDIFHKLPGHTIADRVEVNYFGKKFYNDETKDFYVEMDGYFINTHSEVKEFFISNLWANTTVYVDGITVASTKNTKTQVVPLHLSRGIHHIKVVANSIQTQLCMVRMGIGKKVTALGDDNISKELANLFNTQDYDVLYTSQSYGKTLEMQNSAKPTVLFLDSQDGSIFDIKNVQGAKLAAVVYSGEWVQIKSDAALKLLHVAHMPILLNVFPAKTECGYEAQNGIECPNFNEFDALNEWLEHLTGKRLSALTQSKGSNILKVKVPEEILDNSVYEKIGALKLSFEQQKEQMQKALEDPFYMYKGMIWAKVLKVDTVPDNAFVAYYLDKFDVPQVRYTQVVPRIDISYVNDAFHNIQADDFLGYWVGNFMFVRPVTYRFDMSFTKAKVSVFINNKTVYSSDKEGSFTYSFAPGMKYKIAVKYINDFAKMDYKMDMVKVF